MPRAYRGDGVAGRGENLKFRRTTIALLPLLAIAALSLRTGAQQPPAAQESPWATRAPSASGTSGTTQAKVIHRDPAITPAQRAFAKKFVAALNAEDSAKIRTLIAPDTLKCFDHSRAAFLDAWIQKQFRNPIDADSRLSVFPLPPDMYKTSKMATYPVSPTHLMSFEHKTADSTITINQVVGQQAGVWYLTVPCPTAAGLARFAKIEEMRARSRQRAELVYGKLKEPLKSQMLALIAKHDKASAWKLCIQSLHVDFMTAQAVVDKLANEKKTD
jgi:hypothetical protein